MSRRKGGVVQRASSAAIGRSKDDNNLIEALKLYEGKNYKKSLKLLDTILKKNSSHVDSLALKGLNLYFTGQKEDAESYVNKAIDKIKDTSASPIGCHILGIYMRNVKKYKEAAEWFQASLDNGSTNKQIYRDLATLYSQEHDYKKLLASRKAYWEEFMGYRANWTSLAIAHELNGQRQEAVNVLSKFEELAAGKLGDAEAYEHNECLMYKNDVMYRAAKNDAAKLESVLENLDAIEPQVFDKYGWLERRAAIFMKLNRKQEASKVYRALIKRNPDNAAYYKLLEVSLDIHGNSKLRKALYEKLQKFYPRADPPAFIPLTFITDGDELTQKMNDYIVPKLKRGVPATFCNVKPLYKTNSALVAPIIEKIVTAFYSSVDSKEQPTQFVWTCYFLSQHYLLLKDFSKATEYADKALEHTPTLVELYILKARVLKHIGLLSEAAETINNGRKLDLQDRFINTKTVKYYLRANLVEKAIEVVSIFTKNDESENGVVDLHLMEASWFIVEQAEAYYRLHLEHQQRLQELENEEVPTDEEKQNERARCIKELIYQTGKYKGLALKRLHAIPKFYRQFEDDQLDFHSYCMRKGTPRAYLEMINWGKRVYTLPLYVRALKDAAKMYFSIFDHLAESADEENEKPTTDSVAKKSNKKAKKEIAAMNKRKEEDKKKLKAYENDEDVLGEKLIATKTPLEDFAQYFYNAYLSDVKDTEKDYVLEFGYQLRCGKLALSLGALAKYADVHGKSDGMVGALTLCLLDKVKDSSPLDPIAKSLALKGLERHFPEVPLDKRDDADYDWIEFFTSNYDASNLEALLTLYRAHLTLVSDTNGLKEMIMNALGNQEPRIQNVILKYEL